MKKNIPTAIIFFILPMVAFAQTYTKQSGDFTLTANDNSYSVRVCQGATVTFKIDALQPGTPAGCSYLFAGYQWQIDRNYLAWTNGPISSTYYTSQSNTFTVNDFEDGDRVMCTQVAWYYACGASIQTVLGHGFGSPTENTYVYVFVATHPEPGIVVPPAPYSTNADYSFSITPASLANLSPTTQSSLTYSWSVESSFGTIPSVSNNTGVTVHTADLSTSNAQIMISSNNSICQTTKTASINIASTNPLPSQPNGVIVTGSDDANSINLQWNASTDNVRVANYIIHYTDTKTNQTYTYPPVPAGTSNPVTAKVDGLSEYGKPDPHAYTFTVVATDNDNGLSVASSPATNEYIIDHTVPAIPTGLTKIEQTDNTATFTWTSSDNVGVTGYHVYKDGTKIATTNTNVYMSSLGPLPAVFKVDAFDAKGLTSEQSEEVGVTQQIDPFVIDHTTSFVGIGVQPPSEKLDVDGNLKVRGDIIIDKFDKTKPDVITFTGTSLDIYIPSQAQYNGKQPIVSMTQWGEIKFNSTPYLNYNDIKFLGTGNYINGIGYRDAFGGVSNIGGPVLFGEKGGSLGTKQGSWDGPEQTALKWDQQRNVTVTGTLYNSSLPQGAKPIEDPWVTQAFTSNNSLYPGYQSELALRQFWKAKVTANTPEFFVTGEVNAIGGYRVAGRDIHSGTPDVVNNAPYYGIGISNKILSGTIAAVQVAGYGGIILTDNTGIAVSVYNGNTQIKGNLDFVGTLSHNGSAVSLITMVNNYNTIEGNANVTGTLKVGTNSLIINGSGATPTTGTPGINEIFSNDLSSPLYINQFIKANTIINPGGGTVSIGTTDAGSSYLNDVKLNINGSLVVSDKIALGSSTQNATYGQSYITTSAQNDIEFYTQAANYKVLSLGNDGNASMVGNLAIGNNLNVTGNTILSGNLVLGSAPASITDYKLAVDGRIYARRVTVPSTWADYVFDEKYALMNVKDLETYIKINKHLPGIPSAKEIEKNGLDTGEMIKMQMEKIEELIRYMLLQQKELDKVKAELSRLNGRKEIFK